MSGNSEHPIFFDESGWRRYIWSVVNWSALSILGLLVGCLVLTSISTPVLPLLMPSARTGSSSGVNELAAARNLEPKLTAAHRPLPTAADAAETLRYGYYVNWDENSFSSLRRHAAELDVLVVEWLHTTGADASLTNDNLERQAEVGRWLKANAPQLKIMPLVSNFDNATQRWDQAAISSWLPSASARAAFAQSVLNYVRDGGHAGLVLDFEQLLIADRGAYTNLARELAALFHANNLKLLVAVPPGSNAYQYGALAEASDGLIVMTYDEHAENGPEGPLAGQGWFENHLDWFFTAIDPRKLIVSFGSYGYDWKGPGDGKEISVQEAWELLEEKKARLNFDRGSLNPSFSYTERAGAEVHHVWYLDAITAYNQMRSALSRRPAGLALWRLGTEDAGLWGMFGRGRGVTQRSIAALREMPPGYDVLYQGKGEALSVTGTLKPGSRKYVLDDQLGLITSQEVIDYPKSTTVSRWGASPEKVVALTFDDGPDPRYTPKVLDVLAEKNVKATFFIVGASGAVNRDLLRRLYADGHDIGNHTFTHINTSLVSPYQLKVELNATRRLLEATIGVGTELFRPPFATDLEPQTVDAAQALVVAASLGYVSIGMNVDPQDWTRPFPDRIVSHAVEGIARGDGNVILLHDGGGNRSATIEALPRIIDELASQGYRFVTIHELLGRDRNAVMPQVHPDETAVSLINSFGFTAFSGASTAIEFIFYFGLLLGALRLVWVTGAATVHARRQRDPSRQHIWRPQSVAVLVPAYNESTVICNSILTLLRSRRKKMEIIVIDDGSKDGTAEVVRQRFSRTSRVRVIEKSNGGKSSALNLGLRSTTADIVVAIDADTLFDPNAVALLVRHFEDPRVGAVAGSAHVGNRVNMITRFQALEYMISQNLDRRALDLVNGITVVPGAIGAWRRSALVDIGGYASDTLAEDADVTMRLERAGWRVVYEPRACAYTEAPETVSAFMQQRFRWMFGSLQVAFKNRSALFDRTVPGLGFFGLPNILVFQILFTLFAPIMDVMMIASLGSAFNTHLMFPDEGTPESLITVGTYWLYFQGLEIATAVIAISLEQPHCRLWSALPLLVLQRFFYRQLLYVTAVRVAMVALKGRMVGWGKLLRTGNAIAATGA